MTREIDAILEQLRPAFAQTRTWRTMRDMLYGLLTCMGRRTITGILCSTGQQFADWSSSYRLFEMSRLDMDAVWRTLVAQVSEHIDGAMPLVCAIDDTTMRKEGKKVHGAGWRRDAQGPHFHTNFIWAQRVVEAAFILPQDGWTSPGRAVAVDLVNVPKPARPRKDATPEQEASYRQECEATSIGVVGTACIKRLRDNLDRCPGGQGRRLVVSVDGGYTNRTVFRSVPENTTLIGRIRADAAIFAPPLSQQPTGRPRVYGDKLPTPEQIKNDNDIGWQIVPAYAAGRVHQFAVKTMAPVRWKPAGGRNLRLLVIRELRYRKSQGDRLRYRQPAYLICTDPDMPLGHLLQAYLWRWEIEVGYRDQKTTMGMGQAQVRTPTTVPLVPAFVAMAYTVLHLAAARAGINHVGLPLPLWRRHEPPRRASTAQLLNQVKAELWGRTLRHSFDGFAHATNRWRSPQKPDTTLASAVLYATQ